MAVDAGPAEGAGGQAGLGAKAAGDASDALSADRRAHEVLHEDVARLSPLKHANLNCLGRYGFRA
ncbi:hypothetical protein ACIOHS_41950 [Streptomyces sp. NPDC088253]|uniref:hypothetical protein n=1 Tax=Streptomyces sp. NPDC088253 TaxID=3365846 RepID=UPI00380AD029